MRLAITRSPARPNSRQWGWPRSLVVAATLIGAISMLIFGTWAFGAPQSFANFIDYDPYNRHLIHDVGAFQLGIGVTLVLALIWDDVLTVVSTGFVVASGLHTLSHHLDRHIGGHGSDVPVLGLLTAAGIVGLFAHLRGRTS